MPFALVIIGLLMIVTGARDTHKAFASELRSDFTGPPSQNFIWWIAAIGMIGALGYVKVLAPFSKMFLALVIIVLILAQSRNGGGGFFAQLQNAIASGPEAQPVSSGGSSVSPSSTADSAKSAAEKIATNQQGMWGQQPSSGGQAKFNGWVNYGIKALFGL